MVVIYDVDLFVYYLYILEVWVRDLDFNLKKLKVDVFEVLKFLILDRVKGLEDMEVI